MTTVRLGPVSFQLKPRAVLISAVLFVLVLALMAFHVAYGGTALPYGKVFVALLGDQSDAKIYLASTEFRAPRMGAAVLVGACLAVSGAITQTVARNPLASPDVLGVTSGAGFGAVSVLVLAGGGYAGLSGAAAAVGMPLAAFGTGLLCGVAVYLLAYRRGLDGFRLVLVGLGVSGLASSVTTWLLTLGDVTNAAQALTWMMGSLNGKDWALVQPMLWFGVLLLGCAFALARPLFLASLGDETAVGLGVRVGPLRLAALTTAALLASLATVTAGPLAFVALASPQMARLLSRSVNPPLFSSALVGAVFVLLADTISAHALGVALPVGVATAVVGAPYLVYLVLRSQRRVL
ncbi:ferric enterobactin transport system permease protein [Renibacterium salmoninarum ATCC 33209]|uniref:Ferric enterobactin transport system permease protein n=1 Tax=Renibacterium salmoninarum (strain ATCC 33209 / DSM 20767 / JCM 11484 / NBRC 15589 / NCIMB 2235) TaxID=288705 RepID=A9WMV7_RENSM|nr:iron chelate uptake ABC transporter family permease subunit [Renibacterium salmoninarum]ABY23418.1 ferric enterobactin transport system permease protein [Renibacterium salmoninarum ATCC 33209]